MPQNSSHRIRESSSGALVGKNIAGINGMNSIIGKSSSNILKDDKINLAKINMMNNDPKKKFGTHHHVGESTSNPPHGKSGSNYALSTDAGGGGPPPHNRNNLHIHRITSQ